MAALREAPHAVDHRTSIARRMGEAAREPRTLRDLLTWYRAELAREIPGRLHERGVEPDSALGSPRLAGAFRAYLSAPMATDHDDRLDLDHRGAARRYPIHAALTVMARKWPLSARYLFAVAAGDWQDVALAWHLPPEIGHRFTLDALRHLWSIWARDQIESARGTG